MNKYLVFVFMVACVFLFIGCKEDVEPVAKVDLEPACTIYHERLESPAGIYHSGSEFCQWRNNRGELHFSLTDKEFNGKQYLQIIIEETPTDMLIRVDGNEIWGYDPISKSEFKMYDFNKWPLVEGDSLIYRIYEINDKKITGIADYSDVLSKDTMYNDRLFLGKLIESRCDYVYEDDIFEDSLHSSYGHYHLINGYLNKIGLYTYSMLCNFKYISDIYDQTGGLREESGKDGALFGTYFLFVLYHGCTVSYGLFFKEQTALTDDCHFNISIKKI